jgi:hypothetical protein
MNKARVVSAVTGSIAGVVMLCSPATAAVPPEPAPWGLQSQVTTIARHQIVTSEFKAPTFTGGTDYYVETDVLALTDVGAQLVARWGTDAYFGEGDSHTFAFDAGDLDSGRYVVRQSVDVAYSNDDPSVDGRELDSEVTNEFTVQ